MTIKIIRKYFKDHILKFKYYSYTTLQYAHMHGKHTLNALYVKNAFMQSKV